MGLIASMELCSETIPILVIFGPPFRVKSVCVHVYLVFLWLVRLILWRKCAYDYFLIITRTIGLSFGQASINKKRKPSIFFIQYIPS